MKTVNMPTGSKVVKSNSDHVDAVAVIIYCAHEAETKLSWWERILGGKKPEAWGEMSDEEKEPYRVQASEMMTWFRLMPREDLDVTI